MTRFHHISLNCRDVDVIADFYCRHFGLRQTLEIPLPDGRRVLFLRSSNGVYMELFPAMGERPDEPDEGGEEGPTYRGIRNFSFAVDSIEDQVDAMKGDAHVTRDVISFDQYVPGWRSMWLADPEGNVFQITEGFGEEEDQ